MASPDQQLLSQAAARELLARAGQIDADSTSVDTLRAAAREAGISEAAFEAALLEMRSKAPSLPATPVRRPTKRLALTFATAAFVFAAIVFVIIPRRSARPFDPLAGTFERNIPVQCLSMQAAEDIARTALRSVELDGFSTTLTSGSRILNVRASAAGIDRVEAALKAAATTQKVCDNRPTPVR